MRISKNKILSLLAMTLVTLSLYSCKSSKSVVKDEIFIPYAPDSNDQGNVRLQSVLNFKITTNEAKENVLTWTTPSTYIGRDFELYIYKISGDASIFTLPEPSNPYALSRLYYINKSFEPIKDVGVGTYIDQTYFNSNSYYTYYIYVKVGNDWSQKSMVTIFMEEETDSSQIPTPVNFWKNLTYNYGSKMAEGYVYSDNFATTIPTIGKPDSKCIFTDSGGYMYCADTGNNRVMIYKSDMLVACEGSDPDFYQLCLSIYQKYPYSAFGVIGQEDFTKNYPCGHPDNTLGRDRCLTSPRYLMIADGNLIVSDSGNNRVLVYGGLPEYGCYNIFDAMGNNTSRDCTPIKVVGKKSIFDTANYDLAVNGASSLSNPTGLNFKNGNLYIADTGNHRVVTVRNLFSDETYSCSDGTWLTDKCRFRNMLGQPNFNSKEKFSDKYYANDITYDLINKTLSDGGAFLRKHFANPTEIKFFGNGGNSLMVVSNEKFTDELASPTLNLKGRIATYSLDPIQGDNPICRVETWSGEACSADYFIGQTSSEILIELVNSSSYSDLSYALNDISIDFWRGQLVAVEKNSNQVRVWGTFGKSLQSTGNPPSYGVSNPEGAFDSTNNRHLPNLVGLSSITIPKNSNRMFIFDSGFGRLYEVSF